jgi:cytochrome c-type biogenesis protein
MDWIIIISALWLGILTAISPCPLASNIAAISFIGRNLGNGRQVIVSGLLYAAGRVITYLIIGIGITAGLLKSGFAARFLQRYLNEALGPILIILGMVLLGMIGSGLSFSIDPDKIKEKMRDKGVWFALPLGVIFALSFCPVSAGLYFGALIPMTLKYESLVILQLSYGIGTALPVIMFAFLIAFGGEYLGKAFNCLTKVEIWIRYGAGVLFIITGIYFCLTHIFGINFFSA